ncbi:MAG: M13 family metallopeptidase [Chthoniobacterales bacterium]|nr:M13 family metallopeptidase [Chthoniobacterales bacterium]
MQLLLARIVLFLLLAPLNIAFAAEPSPAPASPKSSSIGVTLNYRDLKVKPGDDFDGYANGGWRKRAEIPPQYSSTGVGLEVFLRAEKRNADLIRAAAAAHAAPDTPERMIAEHYAAYMDTATIEKRALDPLRKQLDEVNAITSKTDLARVMGERLRADVDPLNATNFETENLFGLFVTQALADPAKVMPYLLQGGLGLPDREYYISKKPDMTKIHAAYQVYVRDLLKLAGLSEPAARAERIVTLEDKIAAAHLDRTTSEDPHKANNPWNTDQLPTNAPGLDWKTFLSAAHLKEQPTFIIWMPDATKGLSALVASESLDTWKDWLTFHTLNQFAYCLPKSYDDLHFAFYGKTLQGTPKQRDRWKRAISGVNAYLGDAVGKIYVGKYFPPSSKAEVEAMVKNLLTAFDKRIDALAWMAPATKAEAKKKIQTLKVGVGYPETWREYDGLVINRDDALGNAWRASEWEYQHQLAKLDQPIDRGEWWMTPQTVNAVNLPLQNALNFPAAILEAPFFDPKADAASNYGSIGATIGHEISHSFDNSGADFNSLGKMENWWTPEDLAHFKEASKKLVDQYTSYEPLPGVHINGEQTLAENIADVAGLAAAYDAYHLSLQGQPAPVINGLTGDQRFFLAFAQGWRDKVREPALRQQLVADGHAPARERAQTVRNIDPWYDAYEVKPGEKLYLTPEERVRLW